MRLMRFTGQNMYMAGLYMYNVAYYPSKFYEPLYGASVPSQDYVELMGRMFAANDLKLILGVEFFDSHHLRALDRFTQKRDGGWSPHDNDGFAGGRPEFPHVDGEDEKQFPSRGAKKTSWPGLRRSPLYTQGVPGIAGIGLITRRPLAPDRQFGDVRPHAQGHGEGFL